MRIFIAVLCAVFSIAAAAPAAHAQYDEIVVSGTRVNNRTFPPISVEARADGVLFSLSLASASRDPAARQSELSRLFARARELDGRDARVRLWGGDSWSRVPLETAVVEELIDDDGDAAELSLMMAVSAEGLADFAAVRRHAESFRAQLGEVGRTETWFEDEQSLIVNDPSAKRQTLLQALKAEMEAMRAVFGPSVGLHLTGLEGAVQYASTGPMTVRLCVPYTLSVDDEGN
jgi:hypothetical protein